MVDDSLTKIPQQYFAIRAGIVNLQIAFIGVGNVTIPPPAQKTFDTEGEALEQALTRSFRIRNDAIKSLCSSVRRFRDATVKPECKSDYPHALHALWKALDRAKDLIRD
jgi:hypothetical protein